MAPAGVTIREARSSDIDGMAAMLAQLFALEADFEIDGAKQRRGLALMLQPSESRHVLVAECDGKVVGMTTAQLIISTAEGGTVAWVEDVVVDPDYRKRGIGRALLEAVEHWVRHKGGTRLQLLADRTNLSALAFYRKVSWMPTQLTCFRKKW